MYEMSTIGMKFYVRYLAAVGLLGLSTTVSAIMASESVIVSLTSGFIAVILGVMIGVAIDAFWGEWERRVSR